MKRKYILPLLIMIFSLVFFMYSPIICWDSANYMNYVSIFEGSLPMVSWDVTRGAVFPLIIYISNIFFGKTTMGLLILMYIFNIIMLIFVYKILDEIIQNFKYKYLFIFIGILIVFLNPILFGYYHALLTEFISITVSIISCYFSWKWGKIDFNFKKWKKVILYLLYFCIFTSVAWHLKQPYVSIVLFPFVISNFISCFEQRKVRNFIFRSCSIMICIITLLFSIFLWNAILQHYNITTNTLDNPTENLGNQLLGAVDCIKIVKDKKIYDDEYLNSIKLDLDNKLINKRNYWLIEIYDSNKVIDYDYVVTKNNSVSAMYSLSKILNMFIRHPILIMNSYVTNYFSIINVYGTSTSDGVGYKSIKEFSPNFSNEISSIGFRGYNYNSNIFYMTDDMYSLVSNYEQINMAPKILNYMFLILGKINIYLFKIIFLLLPLNIILSIVFRVKCINKKVAFNYNLILILYGYSILHLLLHTVTGAIIDRYAVPVFLPTLLATFLFFYVLFNNNFKKTN